MSSKSRNAEKRREWAIESERLDEQRRASEAYFHDISSKLEELGIDPYKLKEYLDQL